MTGDVFGTAAIRGRVLAAWADSPARFREDANSEEDLVLGGYRDRLVVELAQNAADAAERAGVPGRLLLALRESADGAVLVAANTGAPLDEAGVTALATLRASAKRDGDTVGRFGVGFAAVLAVSDEPAVVSRSGGVRFSVADTRALVTETAGQAPGLGEELQRRDGHVPGLRLPFAAQGAAPDGYDTAVLLPLRDPAAVELAGRLLDEVGDPLLLALPALTEVVVERPGRPVLELRDVAARWYRLHAEGLLPPEVLATRPVEERGRSRWAVTWALPRPGTPLPHPQVVHAPTPSDEPLPWPALLIATLPLDPARRHVAEGPVTDAVLAAAAQAYTDLLVERAGAGADVWPLVVTGLPAGPLDGTLRQLVGRLLPGAPLLTSAEDPAVRLRPRDAVALEEPVGAEEPLVRVLAPTIAGLVPAPRAARAALERLGVRRLALADVIESLPPVPDPARWHALYAALAPLDSDEAVREALALIPVPLADGTMARGARGLITSAGDPQVADAVALLGARVVHPAAVHPLLERLGATPAGPRAILELPGVRAAVEGDVPGPPEEAPSEEEVADAVLTLVSAAVGAGELVPGDLPWLGELPLPDDEGEPAPALALALPGSPAARWFTADDVGLVDRALLERWGAGTLTAVGVLDGPGVLRSAEVPLDDAGQAGDEGPELDGWDAWCADVGNRLGGLPPGAVLHDLVAVRDLEVVRPDALPEVVAVIAADPALRPALVTPARIVAGGTAVDVPPYTAWWLREELGDGDAPPALAGPGAEPGLGALLPPAPEWLRELDPAVQRALGVVSRVDDLDATAVPGLLEVLADDAAEVGPGLLVRLLGRLADLAARGLEVERPDRLRGVVEGDDGDHAGGGPRTRVVDAGDVVVVDAPMYRQRPDLGAHLPIDPDRAAALADLLDVPLAAEVAAGLVAEGGASVQAVLDEVRAVLPHAPPTWCEHDDLLVDGVAVDWWVDGAGGVHAATTDGLARALAWAGGRWDLRAQVAELLVDPGAAGDVLIDGAFL